MPAKNSRKEFREDSFYHLYNRGVEKRVIFLDDQDRNVFRSYLSIYLLPKDVQGLERILAHENSSSREKDRALKLLLLNNFFGEIDLVAYCLMSNHFHFLIWQRTADAIDRFMQSLITRYSLFFNKKYKRVGHVFQGVYKGVLMETDEQVLHGTRYLHRNPREHLASQGLTLRSYEWSSYPEYLGLRTTPWVQPSRALVLCPGGASGYGSFVEDQDREEESVRIFTSVDIDQEW